MSDLYRGNVSALLDFNTVSTANTSRRSFLTTSNVTLAPISEVKPKLCSVTFEPCSFQLWMKMEKARHVGKYYLQKQEINSKIEFTLPRFLRAFPNLFSITLQLSIV